MLTLRFQRQGKKRDFIFRIIAVDSKIAINSGKSKEILGWWDPRINKFELKKERILYWISQGAQPSDSCYNLLIRAKIIEGKKRPITIRKKKVKEEKGEAVEKTEQVPAAEEKSTEDKLEEKPEEKVEEKKEESEAKEVKDQSKVEEVKTEEKKEVKEEIQEDPKDKKEELKEESKTEEVKEKIKEQVKKGSKEEKTEK